MVEILALDASTTAVGWAVFDGDQLTHSSVFVPDGKLEWWARVRSIGMWLEDGWCRPAYIAYELATGRHGNTHTDRVLGALEYEVRLTAIRIGAELVTVTASQVKAVGVNKDAQELACQIKGKPLHSKHPGDEADAIGVGIAAWGEIKTHKILKIGA